MANMRQDRRRRKLWNSSKREFQEEEGKKVPEEGSQGGSLLKTSQNTKRGFQK
jgi:hypothetical protein